MDGKKIFWTIVLLFVVFFIIQSPQDASDIGRSIGHGIAKAFNGFSEFVKGL